MKFFTEAWMSGDMSPDEEVAVPVLYRQHIGKILPSLFGPVRTLATELNLHDALFQRVTIDLATDSLTSLLRCGDLQVGYFDLELRYGDVGVNSLDLSTLGAIVADPETEVLYDEVDLAERGYAHSFLFSPHRETTIEFRTLSLRREAKSDRLVSVPPSERFGVVGAA